MKVINSDLYLPFANDVEKGRFAVIRDLGLIKTLAKRYCDANGLRLGHYIGDEKYDAFEDK